MTLSNDESRQAAYFAAQIENLSLRAAKSGIVLYSDFLTLPQQKLAEHAAKRAGCGILLYGGTKDSQRKIAAFAKNAADIAEDEFPLMIVKVEFDKRFMTEELTHRDFLGALMHMSIRREMIGDIVIGDEQAYLFLHEKTAMYVLGELESVKHTPVTAMLAESCPLSAAPKFEEMTVTVSSMRADCIAARIMRGSRNDALEAIRLKSVKVDEVTVTKPDQNIREGEEISVRGYGKFRIGTTAPTKKGRIAVTIFQYK